MGLLLALLLPLLMGQAPVEHEGSGEASIVGDNLVSARRRALVQARRAAVAAAVAVLAPEKERLARAQQLQSAIYPRAALYVRTYRVLSEEQAGRVFRARVAARVDTRRLRRDLVKLAGFAPLAAPAAGGKEVLGLSVSGASGWDPAGGDPTARVLAALGLPGLVVKPIPGGGEARAREAGAGALLRVEIKVLPAEGVRGLGLVGAGVELALRLGGVGEGSPELHRAKVTGWGAGSTAGAAQGAALDRALERGRPELVGRLRELLNSGFGAGLRLRVSRLTSAVQLARIRQALASAARGAKLVRVGQGQALFIIPGIGRGDGLASSLEAFEFKGFSLKRRGAVGGQVWLEVTETPVGAGEP